MIISGQHLSYLNLERKKNRKEGKKRESKRNRKERKGKGRKGKERKQKEMKKKGREGKERKKKRKGNEKKKRRKKMKRKETKPWSFFFSLSLFSSVFQGTWRENIFTPQRTIPMNKNSQE